jgi:cell division protein ZapD
VICHAKFDALTALSGYDHHPKLSISNFSFFCVILYEHPFNERVRTYLRLEHLFQRFEELTSRDHPVDNHFALTTLFELVDAGGRTDLKSDILKDLERHKQQFNALRGNPSVSESALEILLGQLEQCFEGLNGAVGKIGQTITDNEWLAALRNRVTIPGGTCCFDLPAYHAWQQLSPDVRRRDILRWAQAFQPMQASVNLLLSLMRDTGAAQKIMAMGGQYQQSLAQGKFQLMRVAIDPALGFIPEISGNRLMIWVRMMRQDGEGRLQASTDDVAFEMALCA